MVSKPIFILSFWVFSFNCTGQEKYLKNIVYFEDFNSIAALDNWIIEDPGLAEINDGKLLLQSEYSEQAHNYFKKQESITDYCNFVEWIMEKKLGAEIEAYKINNKFVGGHIVLLNNQKKQDNYILEYDFQSPGDYSLHMLMYIHSGINGESVFSPELKSRNSLSAQFTKGDMVGYRVSFFAPEQGTTNLRKSPEKKLLIMGKDFTLLNKKAIHNLKLIKKGRIVTWLINGEKAFVYAEKEPTKELDGCYFAIRLRVPAKGAI